MTKTAVTGEQLAKLPKWAKEHIYRQATELETLRRRLAEESATDDSNVHIVDYGWTADNIKTDKPLRKDARIAFKVKGGIIQAYIDKASGRLEVYGQAGGALIVRPHVTNVIQVGFDQ